VTTFDQALLSTTLRQRLAPVHAALESASGLPDSIVTRGDYIACLRMYHRLFAQLEPALALYDHGVWGDFVPQARTPLLLSDLQSLGAPAARDIAPMPPLPGFAQALGVRYVLEGSALGGQVILAALTARLGAEIAGATSFFAGGRDAMAGWRAFKSGLDHYGAAHPDAHEEVVAGAALCFGRFLEAAGARLGAAA